MIVLATGEATARAAGRILCDRLAARWVDIDAPRDQWLDAARAAVGSLAAERVVVRTPLDQPLERGGFLLRTRARQQPYHVDLSADVDAAAEIERFTEAFKAGAAEPIPEWAQPAPRIETERLVLTWPDAAQIDDYREAIVGTAMFDTLLWDGPETPEELHDYWLAVRQQWALAPERTLNIALIEKSSDRYIGGAALRVAEDAGAADLGYALAPAFHGRGYATEAVGALVEVGFIERHLERIYATVFVGNVASRRVLEKLDFAFEGTLRAAAAKRGERRDEWLFARTA